MRKDLQLQNGRMYQNLSMRCALCKRKVVYASLVDRAWLHWLRRYSAKMLFLCSAFHDNISVGSLHGNGAEVSKYSLPERTPVVQVQTGQRLIREFHRMPTRIGSIQVDCFALNDSNDILEGVISMRNEKFLYIMAIGWFLAFVLQVVTNISWGWSLATLAFAITNLVRAISETRKRKEKPTDTDK